jgi:hypothetical protein
VLPDVSVGESNLEATWDFSASDAEASHDEGITVCLCYIEGLIVAGRSGPELTGIVVVKECGGVHKISLWERRTINAH